MPLWRIPSRSPGPRSRRSSPAIKIRHWTLPGFPAFSWFLHHPLHRQKYSKTDMPPLPTLPLADEAGPDQSALHFLPIITVALGTLTPTSITVVDTSTCISFFSKSLHDLIFFSSFHTSVEISHFYLGRQRPGKHLTVIQDMSLPPALRFPPP